MTARPNIDQTLHELMRQLKPGLWAVVPSRIDALPYFVTYNAATHTVSSLSEEVPHASRTDALETLVNGSDDVFDAQPWSKVTGTMLPPRPWDPRAYRAYSRDSKGLVNARATDLLGQSKMMYGAAVILVE